MASLSDILSSIQNIVSAINNVAQTYLQVNGISTAYGVGSATVVKSSPGRLASVSVIVAGSSGEIYDATSTTITSKPIYIIPATLGVVFVNMPFAAGLVVAPGSGQTVSVSYS